jgi:hypothetical protein
MMKKIILSILAGGVLFAGTGCKKFLDVNTDPAGAQKVSDGLLLTGVELTTAYSISGGYPARVSSFWTQQLSYNVAAPDWDNYQVTASDVNNTWAFDMYPAILKNLKILEQQAGDAGHKHFQGVSKVLLAYNLAVTTDLWNDIPYSEGFTGWNNLTPKYDSQETIYKTIETLLNDGITLMKADDKTILPDSKDLIYGGSMDKWVSFAYLLKARYALRLCYAPGKDLATQAKAALDAAKNSFADETGNASVKFKTDAGAESPWYQIINYWGNVVSAKTFIDLLQSTNDPRLSAVAVPAEATSTYVGKPQGALAASPSSTVSAVGDMFNKPDQAIYMGTYDELLFIQAEATYLTAGVATAQPILNDAVRATMKRFGVDPGGKDVQDYLDAHCKLTTANAYEVIMTQKYISNFESLEGYNDWRRTNFPKLTAVDNAYQGLKTIPRRWVYPASETNTNKQPQQPGLYTDRVWWDTQK